MSIALDVARIAEEQAGPAGAGGVVTVALEVGSDAGVEIDNLEFCLGVVLSQPPFRRARAVIDRLPGDVLRVTYLEVDDGNPDD
jgi:Zn finger protein HypA/HybF involved in hydrogenase expression